MFAPYRDRQGAAGLQKAATPSRSWYGFPIVRGNINLSPNNPNAIGVGAHADGVAVKRLVRGRAKI